ncbi:hypothetical protein BDV93DRAFT_547020 [Ceratobasidium sp. AG-I]|nr:hypothetical protein BDV93DRAFT_547020 [Ceratobasidium sp. AG-I]
MPSNKFSSRSCLSMAHAYPSCYFHYSSRAKFLAVYPLKSRELARLPVEITSLILARLGDDDLLQASLVNRLFHYESARILYRTIPRMAPRRSVKLICVLARSPELASLVKSYTISLKLADPVGNLYRRLAKALSHMTNLHSLSFEVPGDKSWILQQCSANIRWFKTSLEFDDKLAKWVATKPQMHDLILTRTKTFPVQSSDLPNLGIIFGTPQTVLSAVVGRPVKSVCFGLNGPVFLDLSNLRRTTAVVDHLGVAFDPLADFEELGCIDFIHRCSEFLPHVQKLSLFATRGTFSPLLYRLVTTLLCRFRNLKYLQFVLGDGGNGSSLAHATQLELLQGFYGYCPTLRNVSFPGNLTWNIE